jgi:hypothetical protein
VPEQAMHSAAALQRFAQTPVVHDMIASMDQVVPEGGATMGKDICSWHRLTKALREKVAA